MYVIGRVEGSGVRDQRDGWIRGKRTLSVTLAKDVGKSTENTIRITSDSG